jgi:hypothetical protein
MMESRFEIDEDWCYQKLAGLGLRVKDEKVEDFCHRVYDLTESGLSDDQARNKAFREMLA